MPIRLGKVIKGVKAFVDTAVLGGVLSNKAEHTSEAPAGTVNYMKLIGGVVSSLAFIVFLYLLLTGKISFDEFKEGVEAVKPSV